MSLGRRLDLTQDYKNNIYSITLDVSNWDTVTAHILDPVAAPVYIYGTNDAGAGQGITDGNASLATNFSPIQGVNLATGSAVNSMSAAGIVAVPVNAQFMRFQGGGADVYRLYVFNQKLS
jgi:hypothetical protein